jgi:hypothetical protein
MLRAGIIGAAVHPPLLDKGRQITKIREISFLALETFSPLRLEAQGAMLRQ